MSNSTNTLALILLAARTWLDESVVDRVASWYKEPFFSISVSRQVRFLSSAYAAVTAKADPLALASVGTSPLYVTVQLTGIDCWRSCLRTVGLVGEVSVLCNLNRWVGGGSVCAV